MKTARPEETSPTLHGCRGTCAGAARLSPDVPNFWTLGEHVLADIPRAFSYGETPYPSNLETFTVVMPGLREIQYAIGQCPGIGGSTPVPKEERAITAQSAGEALAAVTGARCTCAEDARLGMGKRARLSEVVPPAEPEPSSSAAEVSASDSEDGDFDEGEVSEEDDIASSVASSSGEADEGDDEEEGEREEAVDSIEVDGPVDERSSSSSSSFSDNEEEHEAVPYKEHLRAFDMSWLNTVDGFFVIELGLTTNTPAHAEFNRLLRAGNARHILGALLSMGTVDAEPRLFMDRRTDPCFAAPRLPNAFASDADREAVRFLAVRHVRAPDVQTLSDAGELVMLPVRSVHHEFTPVPAS